MCALGNLTSYDQILKGHGLATGHVMCTNSVLTAHVLVCYGRVVIVSGSKGHFNRLSRILQGTGLL